MNSPTKSPEKEKKSITIIFRYADWFDKLLIFFGTIGAIGDGMSTNVLLVFVSRLFNSLGYGRGVQHNPENFMSEIEKVSIPLICIGSMKVKKCVKRGIYKFIAKMILGNLLIHCFIL